MLNLKTQLPRPIRSLRKRQIQWWFLPLGSRTVQRINDYQFYDLGTKLHPLAELRDDSPLKDSYFDLYLAREVLLSLLQQIPLRVCRPAANKVIRAIDAIIPRDLFEATKLLSALQTIVPSPRAFPVRRAVQEFETVLSAELQALDTYFISQKGAYSTSDLIERADIVFPENIRKDLPPQAVADIREAGRCLAFDVPTAAGFHTLRAVEAVMMQYYALVIGKPAPTRGRNWGVYIQHMRKSGRADMKIIEFLDHLREHYRNPTSHPEVNLSLDEAEILLGAAASAIRQMIIAIQALHSSTLPAILPSDTASPAAASRSGDSPSQPLVLPPPAR